MRAGGEVQTIPLPSLRAIGGIGVSFELPEVVLVLTSVNRRRSISGNVPMLVPRSGSDPLDVPTIATGEAPRW